MIDPQFAAFLQEGLAVHIGTRNQHLEPSGARAIALTVEDDGIHVVVYVAKAAVKRLMADLESNGHAAVTVRASAGRSCGSAQRHVRERARGESQ